MNFELVIRRVVEALETQGIRYALIGGFAMALRGVQRATMDLDFILMLEDMRKADGILREFGYECVHQSPNVSQYRIFHLEARLGELKVCHGDADQD